MRELALGRKRPGGVLHCEPAQPLASVGFAGIYLDDTELAAGLERHSLDIVDMGFAIDAFLAQGFSQIGF